MVVFKKKIKKKKVFTNKIESIKLTNDSVGSTGLG